jgi:hypothetical protein
MKQTQRHSISLDWLREHQCCQKAEKSFRRLFGKQAPMNVETARTWLARGPRYAGENPPPLKLKGSVVRRNDLVNLSLLKLGAKLMRGAPTQLRVGRRILVDDGHLKALLEHLGPQFGVKGGPVPDDHWVHLLTYRLEKDLNDKRVIQFFDDVGRLLARKESKE